MVDVQPKTAEQATAAGGIGGPATAGTPGAQQGQSGPTGMSAALAKIGNVAKGVQGLGARPMAMGGMAPSVSNPTQIPPSYMGAFAPQRSMALSDRRAKTDVFRASASQAQRALEQRIDQLRKG